MMKEIKNLSVLFASLLSATLLVACGAATDGSGIALESTDKTSPILTGTVPNILKFNGGEQVIPSSTKSITFIFDESLAPGSIPDDDVLFFITSTGKPLKGKWKYNDSTKDLVFTFDLNSLDTGLTNLPLDETYKLKFNQIADTAGNKVKFEITFKTPQTYKLQVIASGLADKTLSITATTQDGSVTKNITGDGSELYTTKIDAKLAANTDFTLSINTQPGTDTFCAFSNTLGSVFESDAKILLNCSRVVPYYTNNSDPFDPAFNVANWNSYTQPDPAKPFIHAGEKRKYTLSSYYPCTELAASTDELDAFDWACEDDTTAQTTTVYSTGLKKGKYLSDLLDFTSHNWKKNTISVYQTNGALITTTVPAIWWNNPVLVPESSSLSTFETIYMLTRTDANAVEPSLIRSYALDGRHAALVIDPNYTLTAPTSSQGKPAAITITGSGTWLEGKLDAREATTGLLISNTSYAQVRNFTVNYASANGIQLSVAEPAYLTDITSSWNGSNGLNISSSGTADASNIIQNIVLNNNTETGLLIQTNAIKNRLSGVTANNNGISGIALSSNNYLSDSQISSTAGNALTINGFNNTVTMVTADTSDANAAGIFFTSSSDLTPDPEQNFISSVLTSSIAYNISDTLFNSNTIVNTVDASTDSISVGTNLLPDNASNTHTFIGPVDITYLNNAIEPFNDGSGNDNGLCEANEKCLFTPNTGADQGSGDLTPVDDVNNVWTDSGIILEEYSAQ